MVELSYGLSCLLVSIKNKKIVFLLSVFVSHSKKISWRIMFVNTYKDFFSANRSMLTVSALLWRTRFGFCVWFVRNRWKLHFVFRNKKFTLEPNKKNRSDPFFALANLLTDQIKSNVFTYSNCSKWTSSLSLDEHASSGNLKIFG